MPKKRSSPCASAGRKSGKRAKPHLCRDCQQNASILQDQIRLKSCIFGKEAKFGDFSVGVDTASTGTLMPENHPKNRSDYRDYFGKRGNICNRGVEGAKSGGAGPGLLWECSPFQVQRFILLTGRDLMVCARVLPARTAAGPSPARAEENGSICTGRT